MLTDHAIPTGGQDLVWINKKKRTYQKLDFTIPADNSMQIKESKNETVLKSEKETCGTEDQKENRDNRDSVIIKIW